MIDRLCSGEIEEADEEGLGFLGLLEKASFSGGPALQSLTCFRTKQRSLGPWLLLGPVLAGNFQACCISPVQQQEGCLKDKH